MIGFITGSIRNKLVAVSLLLAVVPLGFYGLVSFLKFKDSLERAKYEQLHLVWDSKQYEILDWFHDVADQAMVLSQIVRVRNGLETLTNPHRNAEQTKEAETRISEVMRSFLSLKTQDRGFEDMMLLDGHAGKVLITDKKLSDLGADVTKGKLKGTQLEAAWAEVIKTKRVAVSDFGLYPPTGTPALFVAAPVFHPVTGELMGSLVLRLNAAKVSRILSLGDLSGRNIEIAAVGKDLFTRSRSTSSQKTPTFEQKIDTSYVRRGLKGQSVRFSAKDDRSRGNFGVAGPIGLNKQKHFVADFDWVMVSQMAETVAMEPVMELAYWAVAVLAASMVLVFAAGIFWTRRIASRMGVLADVAGRVSGGDLTVQVPRVRGRDEISALGTAFTSMIANLKGQTARVSEGLAILRSAAAEISSTVSQVATSTSQTSSAVGETAVTMEEVKHAAHMACDKARDVVQNLQNASSVSDAMKTATEDRVLRIHLIREQMDSISETVVRLSDHSREIEEIIGTVQDLADQSNLLAVNASIEAARAGDQGKGFAVVAQEIKTLADQSRQATEQVRAILSDTRKWVSAVVMAAEQGSKAVEAGVEQSRVAQEATVRLTESMTESWQSVKIIETTIEQQFAGVGQVSNSMASIDEAMHQTVEATAQLSEAALKLSDLGDQLRDIVHSYKV